MFLHYILGVQISENLSKSLTLTFPDKPHLALTATATKSAMESLTKILQFEDPNFITENPDRPKIVIEVGERLPNLEIRKA